jgi:hypothetical protein
MRTGDRVEVRVGTARTIEWKVGRITRVHRTPMGDRVRVTLDDGGEVRVARVNSVRMIEARS